ncbi:unnamed protein product, partial [Phaeothamnion confervicola]
KTTPDGLDTTGSFISGAATPRLHTAADRGYALAAALLVCYTLSAALSSAYSLSLARLQLRIRGGLAAAVLRRALALPLWRAAALASGGSSGGGSCGGGVAAAGTLTNNVSVDVSRVADSAGAVHDLWCLPLQVAVTFWLLHREVRFAFAAGIAVMAAVVPLSMTVARRMSLYSRAYMAGKDRRVGLCLEALRHARIVKALGLDGWTRRRLAAARRQELRSLAGQKHLDAWCVFFWATTPVLMSLATFAALVLAPASVFTAVALLNTLIFPLNALPWIINGVVEAVVSAKRLRGVLLAGEIQLCAACRDGRACFAWSTIASSDRAAAAAAPSETDGGSSGSADGLLEPLLLPSDPADALPLQLPHARWSLRDVSLTLRRGELVCVVGRVGSGKSALLHGLLGELYIGDRKGGAGGICSRAIGGGGGGGSSGGCAAGCPLRGLRVAYAAQTPFIQSGSVRDNILFGRPVDEERYRRVIDACSLTYDMATRLGCRGGGGGGGGDGSGGGGGTGGGARLSGGQRRRIVLARCVYSAADVYVLDAPFAGLDAETRASVAQKCVLGLLRENMERRAASVVVATHSRQVLAAASRVILVADGRIVEMGTYREMLQSPSGRLRELLMTDATDSAASGDEKLAAGSAKPFAGVVPTPDMAAASIATGGGEAAVAANTIAMANTAADNVAIPEPARVALPVASQASVAKDSIAAAEVFVVETLSHISSSNGGGAAAHAEGGARDDGIDAEGDADERREEGAVALAVHVEYARAAGVATCLATVAALLAMQATANGFSYWLSIWAGSGGGVSPRRFLAVAAAIGGANTATALARSFLFARGGLNAAAALHDRLMTSLLRVSSAFHDAVPLGRVANRCSGDVFTVDDPLPFSLNVFLAQAAGLFGTLVLLLAASAAGPLLPLLLAPAAALYLRVARLYRPTSRELKRLDSVARSPVFALMSEALEGSVTVRAFKMEGAMYCRLEALLAESQRASFCGTAASTWLGLRLQALGCSVVAFVALAAVFRAGGGGGGGDGGFDGIGAPYDGPGGAGGNDGWEAGWRLLWLGIPRLLSGAGLFGTAGGVNFYGGYNDGSGSRDDGGDSRASQASLAGLALSYVLPMAGALAGLLSSFTETEREMIAVERILEYAKLPPE